MYSVFFDQKSYKMKKKDGNDATDGMAAMTVKEDDAPVARRPKKAALSDNEIHSALGIYGLMLANI